MSKCDTCGRKVYGYLCDGCIHDPENKDLYEPMTNADRIRAMNDEELCDFLYSYKYCDMCEEGCEECRYHGDCERRLAEWLKQPYISEDIKSSEYIEKDIEEDA